MTVFFPHTHPHPPPHPPPLTRAVGGPRRQRPAVPAPGHGPRAPGRRPPRGHRPPAERGHRPPLSSPRRLLSADGGSPCLAPSGPPASDARAGESPSLRQGALTAARAEAPRHPPRPAASPLPSRGAALASRRVLPASHRKTSRAGDRGPRSGRAVGAAGAGPAACARTGRGQLRSRGSAAPCPPAAVPGEGESARPRPPPLPPREAEACPGAGGRALTSCSEQRKISVQRPVQQPMVAAGRAAPRRRRAAASPLLPSRADAAPEAKRGAHRIRT